MIRSLKYTVLQRIQTVAARKHITASYCRKLKTPLLFSASSPIEVHRRSKVHKSPLPAQKVYCLSTWHSKCRDMAPGTVQCKLCWRIPANASCGRHLSLSAQLNASLYSSHNAYLEKICSPWPTKVRHDPDHKRSLIFLLPSPERITLLPEQEWQAPPGTSAWPTKHVYPVSK